MKIVTYGGLGTTKILLVSKSEAMGLLHTIVEQLYNNKHPNGRTEFILENGQSFDVRIDFDKEKS